MRVRILHQGPYSDFSQMPGKLGAKVLKEGDVVEFPDYYAEGIIASRLAEEYMEAQPILNVEAQEIIVQGALEETKPRRRGKQKSKTEVHVV